MGQGMLVGRGNGRASAAELLQFNLTQPVASVIIGCEQTAPLEQNIQAALSFTPVSESGKQRLREKLAPSRSAWENFLRAHEDGPIA
jgi:aryl-alcohol dehydrogenase-like predicted oxidoreductase